MRKIIVLSMISLDGVMQAPGGPEEDKSGGFQYGGWVAPFSDETYNEAVIEELEPADYLLGRKTFEIWAAYWPEHGEFWPGINEGAKYVFSKKLAASDPLITGWRNSVLINTIEDIKALKRSEGKNIQVWGSSKLIQLLLAEDLVDELKLKIHPIILGKGKNLFADNGFPASFTLMKSVVTTSGVIIADYKRSGEIKTGTAGA